MVHQWLGAKLVAAELCHNFLLKQDNHGRIGLCRFLDEHPEQLTEWYSGGNDLQPFGDDLKNTILMP
jgi:hypothetical protein